MDKTVAAVYENGVLRPLEKLDLPEHQQVQVTIAELDDQEVLDWEYIRAIAKLEIPEVSLEEVRQALSCVPGTLTSAFIEDREERF